MKHKLVESENGTPDQAWLDQWIVDTACDYYKGVSVQPFIERVLAQICTSRREGKTIAQIRIALRDAGIQLSKRDVRGVLITHQQHTGENLGVLPNTQ